MDLTQEMKDILKVRITSGLTKARLNDKIEDFPVYSGGTALRGDRFFFSVLLTGKKDEPRMLRGVRLAIHIESALAPYITIYRVDNVPVRLPHYNEKFDDDYITHEAGLLPDLLRPTQTVYALGGLLHQLCIELNVPADMNPGDYPVTVVLSDSEGNTVYRGTLDLKILNAQLPEQELIHTQWFHCDCLADYYRVPVFSERHWEIIENFAGTAVRCGINALLTPVFTPPLDTMIGGERPTVQLVDVIRENGKYRFGFEKLKRFCDICRRVGVRYLEIAHFFTQWGAKYAPKIMATDNGEYRRIFGWETEGTDPEYIAFLRALIPPLREKLDEYGYKGHYFFHISDEPNITHLETYDKAKKAIWDLISDCPVRDALSSYEFYEKGVSDAPISSTDHADVFVANHVPNLWVYYCCSESVKVSNRFLAMPGYRTRVLGAQLYKAEVKGFLQWGFNFYYNRSSLDLVDPYLVTDADYFVPAGDAYSVYPAPDGTAYLSLHQILFEQALYDLRAMQLAEKKVGREKVLAEVERYGELDFMHYPKNDCYTLTVRENVNRMAAGEL